VSGEDVRVGRGRYDVFPELSDAGMAQFKAKANSQFEIAGLSAGKAFGAGFTKSAASAINLTGVKSALAGLEKEFAATYSRIDPNKHLSQIKPNVAPNFTSEMQKIISLNQKMDAAASRAAKANDALGTSTRGVANGMNTAANATNRAATAHQGAANSARNASTSYRNMGGAADALQRSHIPLLSSASALSSEFTKMASRISYNAFQLQLLGQNITRYVTLPLGVATAAITLFGLKASADVEDATASLKALLPAGVSVKNTISQIQDIAVKSPIFKFTDLLRNVQQLIGAGLDINKVLAFEKSFSRIGTTLALTPEQTQSAQIAIVQMLNKGKVYAEELVQQLAEHVPGAIKMLADYFHVTTGELLSMVKAGQLSGKQVVQAFTDIGNSKKFVDGAANSAQTFRNQWNQLKESITVSLAIAFAPLRDKLKELIVEYGPGLTKTFKDIGTSISSFIVGNVDHWIESFQRLQKAISPEAWNTIAHFIGILAIAGPGILITAKALQAISAALALLGLGLNPTSAIIIGLGLMALGFAAIIVSSEQIRRQLGYLKEDLKKTFQDSPAQNRIADFFKDVKDAAQATQDFIVGNFVPTLRALFLGEDFMKQTTDNAKRQVTYPQGNGTSSLFRNQVPLAGQPKTPGSVERQQTPYALVPGNQDKQPNKTLIDTFKDLHDAIQKAIDKVNEFFRTIAEDGTLRNFKQTINDLDDAFRRLGIHIDGTAVLLGIFAPPPTLGLILDALGGQLLLLSNLTANFAWMLNHVLVPAFQGIVWFLSQVLWPAFKIFIQLFTGDFPGAWNTFWSAFGKPIYDFFVSLLPGAVHFTWTWIQRIWDDILNFFIGIWDALWGHSPLRDMYLFFSQWLPDALRISWNWVVGIWNAVLKFLTDIWGGIYNRFVLPFWNALTQTLPGAASFLKNWASDEIGRLNANLAAAFGWLYSHFFLPIWNQLVNVIPNAFGALAGAASSWVSKMGDWIVGGFNWILDKMESFLGKFNSIKNALHLPIPDVHVGGFINTGGNNAAQLGLNLNPNKRATGGVAPGLRSGIQHGPGNGTSDGIVAVSNDEYVVNAKKTKQWLPVLDAINFGRKRATGGLTSDGIPGYSIGGFLAATLGAGAHAVEGLTQEMFDYITDPGHVIGKVFDSLMSGAGRPEGYVGDFGIGIARRVVEAFGQWFSANISAKFSQGDFEGAKAWAKAQAGKPYSFGAVGPSSYDCSGSQGNVWAILTGHPLYQRYMTTMSDFSAMGFDKGEDPGGYSIFVNPFPGMEGHMMGSIQGHLFEFGDPGHYDTGTSNPHSFAQAWHLARGIVGGGGGSGSAPVGGAQAYARALLASHGWGADQWGALQQLWDHESNWNANSVNPSSGAYGIPQALGQGHPFNLGDFAAQVRWGEDYIAGRYGSPNAAWAFWQAHHWYDGGGELPTGFSAIMNGTGQPEHVVTAPKASYLMDAVANPAVPVVNVYVGNELLDERTDYRIELKFDDLAREINAS